LKLNGKVALITGASRGIGRAIGRRFAEEGASVVVNYATNRGAAEELCEEIRAAGGKAIALGADVADAPQVNHMVEAAIREFKRIDILVNNAGILKTSTLLDATLTDLDRMIDVNLKGVMHCVRAVAGEMMKRKEGKILNLASIGAMGTAFPGTTVYAATKGAIIALTKRLAFEFGPYNINVNALAPGFIRSDMTLHDGDLSVIQGKLDLVASRAMLGRIGEPQDVAGAAVFLVSPDAAFITAQTLTVDGGRMDLFSHSA
jgi:3-oxoacyl-[acyl-carrier protein] reductase